MFLSLLCVEEKLCYINFGFLVMRCDERPLVGMCRSEMLFIMHTSMFKLGQNFAASLALNRIRTHAPAQHP